MSTHKLVRPFGLLGQALVSVFLLAACGTANPPVIPIATTTDTFLPPEGTSGFTPKTIAYANRDMVSAANPLAVQAGVDVLAKGGTAVDAAIAVQMVLNLVEPQSSGIGGGAFMVYFNAADGKLTTFDGRETAPAAATGNMFLAPNGTPLAFATAVNGGLSVGTPGLLRMLEMAHKKHGSLPWASLFDAGIKLSNDGFAMSSRLVTLLNGSTTLRTQEPAASYFYQPDPADATKLISKPVGTVLKNPDLAASFDAIAKGGAAAFYTGPIAQDIVNKVRNHPTNPGRLTMQDMADYQAKERTPVCGTYRTTYKVCGMGMPSSGATTVAMTLGILNQFNVAQYKPSSVDAVHLISEAYRLTYADRGQYMADADFVSVPVAGLLNTDYLKARAALIKMDKSMGVPTPGTPAGAPTAQAGDFSLGLPATSHMSIVDRFGNAVSMTTTIENGFGSLQMVRGFLLNNQLTDFSFAPTDAAGKAIANRVEPGKRPRSSMSPTIVLNDKNEVEMIVGSPGGSNIIQYVTKTIVGVIDWKLNIQQAINLPNFGAQTSATTTLERLTSIIALETDLKARGHTVAIADINSGIHGITYNGLREEGVKYGNLAQGKDANWAGGADPRREGTSQGNLPVQ